MENIEIVRQNIKTCVNEINTLFKSLNNPSNILIKKDRSWGKYTVNMFLRLDEISTDELDRFIPQLKSVLNQYHELRKIEASLTDQADMERSLNPMKNFSGYA